jgi:hypothetical protein
MAMKCICPGWDQGQYTETGEIGLKVALDASFVGFADIIDLRSDNFRHLSLLRRFVYAASVRFESYSCELIQKL